MYKQYEKISCFIWTGAMCIGLLILMYLGLFNHPTGDDYYYAVTTKQVLEETGSVWKMLAAAVKGVGEQYVSWQGTYSAMFFMYLPPNVFGENCYRLVTAGILTLYTAGVFYLFKPFICTVLNSSKYVWCSVAAVFVTLTVQTVQFQGESFFWYNGSMYYTGYLAFTFFFFGAMCRYLINGKKYYLPMLWLMAAFLAGGNYVSLLPTIIISVLLTATLLKRRSPKAWVIGLTALFLIIGLLVSAAAPGNQVRGGGSLGNMSAMKAILLSVLQSISYLEAWLNRWWLMAVIVLTPFFWRTYQKTDFAFPMPVLVVGLIHGIFCSMSCPTFYAEGTTGPARVVAIIYYGFMLSTLINYYYLLGYLYRWWQKRVVVKTVDTKEKKNLHNSVPWLMAAGVFLLLLVMQIYSGEMTKCSSVQAISAIKSNDVFVYEQEYQERLKVLADESVQDVVFEPYTRQPAMLYVGDFTEDINNPNNVQIAAYFNKNSIKVDYLD